MKKIQAFTCHGIDLTDVNDTQATGSCPFCSKKNHFYVNVNSGQWDCKKCGESGNVFSFLKKYTDMIYDSTTTAQYRVLAKMRGLPIRALREWKLGWDGSHWLMPVLSETKVCRDVRRWKPGSTVVKSTAGCKSQLYGWYKAARTKTLWLCEGEWDTIAMSWLLEMTGRKHQNAVGVPGALTFKDEWIDYFTNRNIYICYDKDSAGEHGALKVYNKLSNVTKNIQIIKWPIQLPEKYDIRDYIKSSIKENKSHQQMLKELKSFLTTASNIPMLIGEEDVIEEEEEILENPPTFNDTLRVYKKWCRMKSDLIQALKIMFATVLSTKATGEPLWIYIIGPAGCGKTMLLMSLDGSRKCIFRSNISSHALISGFKGSYDPSLLPKLNGKCCIWKDFTEILSKKSYEKDDIYSTLRGAYDGHVIKSWGNNVIREYPDLHFSMLAGVTPAVHGDKKASLGERFLKYEIYGARKENVEEQIHAAIRSMTFENQQRKELQQAAKSFLSREVDSVPEIPRWVIDRVVALAQIISLLRASSEREMFGDRSVLYKPASEVGTRLAKQLLKLGQFLALVMGREQVSYKEYKLMEKVGFDTSIKTHLEILKIIMDNQGKATTTFISDKIMLSRSSVERQLHDLRLLGVLQKIQKKTKTIGRAPIEYSLSKNIVSLWDDAKIGISCDR